MDKNYSVDDILSEIETTSQPSPELKSGDDDFESIMAEILGKEKPQPKKEKAAENLEKTREIPMTEVKKQAKAEEKSEIKAEEKKEIVKEELSQTAVFEKPFVKEEKKDFKVKFDLEKVMEPESKGQNDEKQDYIKSDFEDKTIQMEPFGLDSSAEPQPQTSAVSDDDREFRESRKEKVEKFVLFGEEEQDTDPEPEEEPLQEVKTIEDFNDYGESVAIVKDLAGIRAGLVLRVIVLSVLSIVSAYIELGSLIRIPVIDIFNKSVQPLSYLIVSALIFVASLLVSAPAVFGGIASLFRFKPDGDSFLAVASIGAVAQYVALFTSPQYISGAKNTIAIYGFIVILNMLFNAIGKLSIIRRVRINFRFVSGGYEKYAVTFPESEKLNNFVREQFDSSYASVAVPKKTDFIGNFLSYSYKEDLSDQVSKILAPIIFIGSLALSVVSFVLTRDVQKAASTFAAILAISSPVSVMLSVNLPFLRTAKKIASRGSMVSSLAACNEVYDTNSVLVKSADLFPKGSIQLSAIKTFAAGKIDDVILDAASVVIRAESDLTDVFLSVIGGRRDLLKEVDTIVYEESMGLSAWVDSKRVLIGNRELILNHGIAAPSKDYEDRYLSSGMDMVYLAESGELVAVFLIQYRPGKQIKKAMKALKNIGIGVVVASTDPNINSEKIAKIFDVEVDMIRTVPAEKQGETEKLTRPSSRENVGVASISSFSSFVQTIYAAIRLKSITSLAVTIQTVGLVLGFALMAFFTVMLGTVSVSVGAILLYQLFWLVATVYVPMLRSVKI